MTHSDSSRLDRIEAMLETLSGAIEGLREGLAEVRELAISNALATEGLREGLAEVRKLTISNARAIEASRENFLNRANNGSAIAISSIKQCPIWQILKPHSIKHKLITIIDYRQ